MKLRNKIFIACSMVLTFAICIFTFTNNNVYASSYESYDYNLIDFTGSKTEINNSISFNNDTLDYTFTHTMDSANWGTVSVGYIDLNAGDTIYMKTFKHFNGGIGLETFVNGNRITYEGINDIIDKEFVIEYTATYSIIFFADPWKESFTENVTPYIGYYDINSYIPSLSFIYDIGYDKGVLDTQNVNGIWGYISNVYVGTDSDNNYSFEDLISNGWLNGFSLNLYSMSLIDNDSYTKVYIDIELDNALITEFDLFFKGSNNYILNIYDKEGLLVTYDISENLNLNYQNILSDYPNFSNYISQISIVATSPDSLDSILNNSSYTQGFQNGYNAGYSTGNNIGYDNGYNEGFNAGLNDFDNNELHYDNGYNEGFNAGLNDIDNNESHYNNGYSEGSDFGYKKGYSEGYEIGLSEDGANILSNTLRTVVASPFDIFQRMFDFNIFGINIHNIVFSFLTMFIIIWVVKKFIL